MPAVRVDPQPGWTYEEFRREPEQWGMELLDGWWVREPAPSLRHQEVLGRLYAAWLARLGEPAFARVYLSVHVVLAPGTVVQPDLCYLGPGSRHRAVRGAVHGPPDLVVEVTSEATRERDLVFKRRIYAEHRVPEYWVLDPEWEYAYLFRRPRGRGYAQACQLGPGSELACKAAPGLRIPLGEVLGTPVP